MTKQIDFTRGNITTQLILFSLPLVAGELLQSLYNSVDALVVGNFVSDAALGAVSVCATLVNLVVGFFNGMSVGATSVVARAVGRNDEVHLRQSIQITFTFSAALGAALSLLGVLCTDFLIGLSAVEPEIFAEATVYLRIYLAGTFFTVIYNNGAGILRATGDTRTPFLILSISGVLNILLDLLFVVAFRLGVAGVGYATVISQSFSALTVYRQINRQCSLNCLSPKTTFRDGGPTILEVIRIGIPSGVQGALISFSNLFVWRYVNPFGKAATAGVGIALRLDKFISLPCKAIGMTTTTFVSQNIGARNRERVQKGIWHCMALSLGTTAVLELIVYLFSNQLVSLFNSNPEIIRIGVSMERVLVPLYVLLATREVIVGILRAHGYAQVTMLLSLVGMVGVRQLYLYLSMSSHPVLENVYRCFPLAWGSTLVLLTVYYFLIRKSSAWEAEYELGR